jgi:hypothetical protein
MIPGRAGMAVRPVAGIFGSFARFRCFGTGRWAGSPVIAATGFLIAMRFLFPGLPVAAISV